MLRFRVELIPDEAADEIEEFAGWAGKSRAFIARWSLFEVDSSDSTVERTASAPNRHPINVTVKPNTPI
jgi:hypothetical protein